MTANELLEFAGAHDFQVLALEGASTQYMWTTWRKQPAGWFAAQEDAGRENAKRADAGRAEGTRRRRVRGLRSSRRGRPSR